MYVCIIANSYTCICAGEQFRNTGTRQKHDMITYRLSRIQYRYVIRSTCTKLTNAEIEYGAAGVLWSIRSVTESLRLCEGRAFIGLASCGRNCWRKA